MGWAKETSRTRVADAVIRVPVETAAATRIDGFPRPGSDGDAEFDELSGFGQRGNQQAITIQRETVFKLGVSVPPVPPRKLKE